MSFVFAVEHGMNDILSIADETRPLLNSSVLNRNGLSDFPGFALTLEALREKEITTDPITGGDINEPGKKPRCDQNGKFGGWKDYGESTLRAIVKTRNNFHRRERLIRRSGKVTVDNVRKLLHFSDSECPYVSF